MSDLTMMILYADFIAVPDFPTGAMENWGLITFRLTSILYDPSKSSHSNKQWVAVVVAHELAHQVISFSNKMLYNLTNNHGYF